jgi:hypothetical protein
MSDKTKIRLKFIISGIVWITAGVFVGGKVEPILWDILIPLIGFAATLFGLKFVAPTKD